MAKRRPLPEERPVRLAAARCRRARRDVEPLGVPLTGRQREMLALIADGLTRAAIARRLGLAEDTVEHYVTAIRERLGVHSTPAAVAAGFRLGLLGDGPAPPDPLLAAKAAAYDRVAARLVDLGATLALLAAEADLDGGDGPCDA